MYVMVTFCSSFSLVGLILSTTGGLITAVRLSLSQVIMVIRVFRVITDAIQMIEGS